MTRGEDASAVFALKNSPKERKGGKEKGISPPKKQHNTQKAKHSGHGSD